MASIRKRGSKWQAQVRRHGASPLSKSFLQKADAHAWARAIETQLDRGELQDRSCLNAITVGALLKRYRDTVTIRKPSRETETFRINALLRQAFARKALSCVSADDFARYRDGRLSVVKPATVNRELSVLQHMFQLAQAEWAIPLRTNPLSTVRRPKAAPHRERRLKGDEEAKLFEAANACRNRLMHPLITLALETAMRRGELLNIRKADFCPTERLLHVPKTKSGLPRTIPLTKGAAMVLAALTPHEDGRLLPLTGNAVRLSWERLTRRAGIADLHFHDLRHEAISRFFEMGLSVPEVTLISGHRDARQLLVYTHLRAEDVAIRLRNMRK